MYGDGVVVNPAKIHFLQQLAFQWVGNTAWLASRQSIAAEKKISDGKPVC